MIIDKDKGFKALQARLADDDWKITIGVHESAGQHDDSQLSVADIATYHEYGLGVPRRSFIGDWFDGNDREMSAFAARQYTLYIKGTKTKEGVLAAVGSFAVGGIQQRIAQGIDPPLAPSTIARKGSTVPLIDTGQLRTSITWQKA